MATEKELELREIYKRGMAAQSAAKGPQVSMFCTGGNYSGARELSSGSVPPTPFQKQELAARLAVRERRA